MKLYDSLIDLLRDASQRDREIRFIDGEKEESTLAFADLWERAACLLGALQAHGMKPGDELIIFTRSNEQFLVAFWAAVLGGIVPVPVAVGISDEHRFKLFRIIGQMKDGTLYTDADLLERLREFAAKHEQSDIGERLEKNSIVKEDIVPGTRGSLASPGPEDVAFVQYSSGSTSDPKGICLTHLNLCTNIRAISEVLDLKEDESGLSWMPLTHDMGLIGFHLCVLATGMNHAVMDTSLFVRRPLLWMSKASELQATLLCSPNFGYKHFLKMFARKGLDNLDLSPVNRILNGAEPISWNLCQEFLDALEPYGLRRDVIVPCYGLAEASVGVTILGVGDELSRIVVDRHDLRVGAPVKELPPDDPDAVSFIRIGSAIRNVEVRLVDDNEQILQDGLVGNIQIRGDSVTGGLYNDPVASAELFTADNWLRTGDVGVIADGQLAITGRSKDIIIVNGQNYYPHDIEEAIASLEQFDLGKVAVSGVAVPGGEGEAVVVFLLYRKDLESFAGHVETVKAIVGETIGIEVDHVVPVARIPKTTSGKIQRAHLARDFAEGEFAQVLHELQPLSAGSTMQPAEEDELIRDLINFCHEFSNDRVVGADDNLFEAGISSLALTEIMLAVDEKYPGKVDISDLFDYPTIRELADFMRKDMEAGE